VAVATPTQRDVTVFQDFTGNTEATESVEIRARVKGFLESFDFEPSTLVRKGDLLFTIERAQYAAAEAQAEADLKASEAYLRRTESDLERLEQAIKTNAVSQQEVSRATAERDQARAALLGARAKLDRATIDLGYTEIRAPLTGLISRQLVDPGNLVGHNEPTLLARVFKVDPIFVYFEVNEQTVLATLDELGGMRGRQEAGKEGGTPVEVSVDGLDRTFEGRTDYLDPTADPDTGTVQVRAVVPNSDGLLLPGLFVRIRVPGKRLPGALLVPETTLSTDLGGRYLMLVNDEGLAEKRYVQPGQLQEGNLRIVLDGLEPGDRFIVEGLQRARPGMAVRVASD
jgi:RND family efflux transporter MFP subunit